MSENRPPRRPSSRPKSHRAEDVKVLFEKIAVLTAEAERLKTTVSSVVIAPPPLPDKDIRVGLEVDVVIGPGRFAPCRVGDIWTAKKGGGLLYEVVRLDDAPGKKAKALGLKESKDIFPLNSQRDSYVPNGEEN